MSQANQKLRPEGHPIASDSDSRPHSGPISHKKASRDRFNVCDPYDGPEDRWREHAAARSWVIDGIDRPSLSWPTPTCGTQRCLFPAHLSWIAPKKLEYPNGICVYCGTLANTKDHLLPRTWTGDAVRRRNVLVVSACLECNCFINDRYAPSITERRKLAHDSIQRRHARILSMPHWSEKQIAELGATPRSVIRRGMHEKRLTLARIAWPEDPDYDLRAMHHSGIEEPYAIGLLT